MYEKIENKDDNYIGSGKIDIKQLTNEETMVNVAIETIIKSPKGNINVKINLTNELVEERLKVFTK